jgi:uncharacterized repeat protein (TIGR01451 family)
MKKLYSLILGLMLSAAVATAQNCYQIVQLPYYPFPFVDYGNLSIDTVDDLHSDIIPIGFDFCYFGNTYSELVISTNGYVTFDTALANTPSPWNIGAPSPTPGVPNNVIMSPWQDLNPSSGGYISYHTYGLAPYRKFVVSYGEVSMFSCTNLHFSNQVVLYESLNIIDINIAERQLCETWNNGMGVQGIQNADGTEAYIVPGRNFPELWTSIGDSYRFIPQCYCEAPIGTGLQAGIVAGKVFWDYNQDCILDPGEPGIPNVKFDIQPNDGIIWSGYQGNIAFMADPGSFTMEHSADNPWYLTNICPMVPVDITVYLDSTVGPYFWSDTVVPFQDLSVNVGSSWLAVCFPTVQIIQVCNSGTVPAQNVRLKVLMPDILGEMPVSSLPYTFLGDTLLWEFAWMDPGECITVNFQDSVPCSAMLVGSNACIKAWVTMDSLDVDSLNNFDQVCDILLGSYDPNDKQAHGADHPETPFDADAEVVQDESIEYLIRFQNTGTFAAYNITIRDTLSPLLDVSTIVPGASSHFYTAELREDVLTFHFPSIFLPDSASDPVGSQGWVYFTIDQAAGNGLGTVIPNSAAIYFDNNEPVITDTSFCTVVREEVVDTVNTGLNDMAVFQALVPNPANTEFRIIATDYRNIRVEVLDISGRSVISISNYQGQAVDVSRLSQGIYPVRVSTPGGVSTVKLIRN